MNPILWLTDGFVDELKSEYLLDISPWDGTKQYESWHDTYEC